MSTHPDRWKLVLTAGQVSVVPIGLGLVALRGLLHAWALYPSWFFTDDYRLLLQALDSRLDLGYLVRPFDSQFMPFGRLLAWIVAQSGVLNWNLAATIVLAMNLAAGAACLWMLVTLFGPRWPILVLLGLYLTSALTLPATMWWAAAINQVPLQIAFFLSVGTWTRYLRSRSTSSLGLTLGIVALALMAYVKTLLIPLVLAYLMVAYFTAGRIRERLATLLRRYRLALVAATVLVAGYVLYYLVAVPQPFEETSASRTVDLVSTVLGKTIPTALVGGPWIWWETSPPIVLASPPEWAVSIAWVLILGAIAHGFLRRVRTLRAWGLLLLYVFAVVFLLATSRGQLYGSLAGLELRYLTDLAGAAMLALGLAYLPLRGTTQGSMPRAEPLLRRPLPATAVGSLVGMVLVGGLASSFGYIDFWHHHHSGANYVRTLQRDLQNADRGVHLADSELPDSVMPDYTAPYNRLSTFTPLVERSVNFSLSTTELFMVDGSGQLRKALVNPTTSSGTGPVENCGWLVKDSPVRIPLKQGVFDWPWWVRIGYLSPDAATARVRVGDNVRLAQLSPGVGSLYVSVVAGFDSVEVMVNGRRSKLCVDQLEVGDLVPMPEG